MRKKKFGQTKVGKMLKGLAIEGLQTVPVLGTLVTAFKENTKNNPEGAIKLNQWHIYRMVLGLVIAYLISKGFTTAEDLANVMDVI